MVSLVVAGRGREKDKLPNRAYDDRLSLLQRLQTLTRPRPYQGLLVRPENQKNKVMSRLKRGLGYMTTLLPLALRPYGSV